MNRNFIPKKLYEEVLNKLLECQKELETTQFRLTKERALNNKLLKQEEQLTKIISNL